METVSRGGAVFGPDVAGRILAGINQPRRGAAGGPGGGEADGPASAFPGLTRRECDILALLATGQSNHAIARSLGLSAKTVANQLSTIYSKLQVTDRAQAMIRARDAGLASGSA